MTPRHSPHRGVTLVELLVVMSILTAMFALAVMLVPNINQTNAVSKGAGEVQSAFRAAQGMASAARLPRGVRFLVNSGYVSTTLQYLEMPPIIIADPQPLVAATVQATVSGNTVTTDPNGPNTTYGPRVEFLYTLAGAPGNAANAPAQNAITMRHCYIRALTPDQAAQVVSGATLVLPVLGWWARITSASNVPSTMSAPNPYTSPRTNSQVVDIEAILEVYPDAALGTATSYRTFHFGLYGVPVPLLAEPTVPLPTGIAADLQISYPPLSTAGQNYDVMFSPTGPTVGTANVAANTNVYIWIRDITKITNPGGGANQSSMNGQTPPPLGVFTTTSAYADAFRRAGDQLIVGVRAGGFVGTAPVNPIPTTGYPTSQGPFTLAQQQLGK